MYNSLDVSYQTPLDAVKLQNDSKMGGNLMEIKNLFTT